MVDRYCPTLFDALLDAQGIRHSEMQVSYRTDQPEVGKISQTLNTVDQQNVSQVVKHGSDRIERQQAASRMESTQAANVPQLKR